MTDWISKKKKSKDYKLVKSKPYDDYNDFKIEPTGFYALIRILFDKHMLALAVCNKNHEIVKEFHGRRSQDILKAIFEFEKQNKIEWFTLKEHIAYLGRELKKAEIHLALGNSGYYQE